ncbi:serine/threonine-protein kinase Nek5 isoform X2 [Megalopta genalis]|uniref:serine/threonine-protein kinase Nek5 isoform X2 n=1 Tax=Megalopta genalis TaxID=115081 RepID=UPI003FD080D2
MSMHISDYVFETLLGRGTFGSVYLVRRKTNSKPFVVKEQMFNAANALPFKNILGEVQYLHKLRHPNIVAYYGAWIEDDRCYILMEYATRCTLKDLLNKRRTPLTEGDALYLFSQVVLGVHHIHYKKILHRDLKPENIMLTGSRGDIVKIGDFGISKNFQEYLIVQRRRYARRVGDSSITCRAGSLYYMAPEIFERQCYDFKCDIWSMGVVLYEMVTKRHPFPATLDEFQDAADIVKMVCKEQPRSFRGYASPAIVNLISKMLRKLPFSRPKTDQLMLCPYLVPFIARTYLNLGRVPCTFGQEKGIWNSEVFLKFLKPLDKHRTI